MAYCKYCKSEMQPLETKVENKKKRFYVCSVCGNTLGIWGNKKTEGME